MKKKHNKSKIKDNLVNDICPFCLRLKENNIIIKGKTSSVIPVEVYRSIGHCLIVPHEHIENYFNLTKDVIEEMHYLLYLAKKKIEDEEKPMGWNIRVNIGKIAGQTVGHTHIHLLPRYKDDNVGNPNYL